MSAQREKYANDWLNGAILAGVPGECHCVVYAIALHMIPGRICRPGIKRLTRLARISERTVLRHIGKLESLNLLTVTRPGTKGKASRLGNRYEFTFQSCSRSELFRAMGSTNDDKLASLVEAETVPELPGTVTSRRPNGDSLAVENRFEEQLKKPSPQPPAVIAAVADPPERLAAKAGGEVISARASEEAAGVFAAAGVAAAAKCAALVGGDREQALRIVAAAAAQGMGGGAIVEAVRSDRGAALIAAAAAKAGDGDQARGAALDADGAARRKMLQAEAQSKYGAVTCAECSGERGRWKPEEQLRGGRYMPTQVWASCRACNGVGWTVPRREPAATVVVESAGETFAQRLQRETDEARKAHRDRILAAERAKDEAVGISRIASAPAAPPAIIVERPAPQPEAAAEVEKPARRTVTKQRAKTKGKATAKAKTKSSKATKRGAAVATALQSFDSRATEVGPNRPGEGVSASQGGAKTRPCCDDSAIGGNVDSVESPELHETTEDVRNV